jgi:predicted anti-sigma-YlaC factor YlaD
MSDTWSERLSEYLDGSLTPAEARALERHLPECEGCRTALAELRSVQLRLSSDPVTQADQPTELEWVAIRRSIAPARRRWLVPAALAASLIGMAVMGGLFLRKLESPEPAALYLQATADLEALLRDNASRLRPETVQALQESMAQIDAAVAQAERALRADPANDYLTHYLGELHQARMMTLRQAVAVVHLKS